jgi:hypothetical protein
MSLNDLHRRWIQSHEEDTDDEVVYRPESFPFPRSRGRFSFELKPDLSLIETGIAPTDGPLISHGKWRLDSAGQLFFYNESKSEPVRIMQIVSVNKDQLIIRK